MIRCFYHKAETVNFFSTGFPYTYPVQYTTAMTAQRRPNGTKYTYHKFENLFKGSFVDLTVSVSTHSVLLEKVETAIPTKVLLDYLITTMDHI
jgi:hypothetical protein